MENPTHYQSKSEVISVRLTPKLRYALELHARLQHRSMGQTIERALERLLSNEDEGLFVDGRDGVSRRSVFQDVWSVFPHIRLIRLASLYPELLTPEEEVLWDCIQSDWRLNTPTGDDVEMATVESRFNVVALELHWEDIVKLASQRLGRALSLDGKTVRPSRKLAVEK